MPCMINRQSRKRAVSDTESVGASLCGRVAGTTGAEETEGRPISKRCEDEGTAGSVNDMYLLHDDV
jgi:hypothetical protein